MIAEFHALAVKSLPNTELIGFCNIRTEKAVKMAEKHGVKYWDSADSMFKSDEVDLDRKSVV